MKSLNVRNWPSRYSILCVGLAFVPGLACSSQSATQRLPSSAAASSAYTTPPGAVAAPSDPASVAYLSIVPKVSAHLTDFGNAIAWDGQLRLSSYTDALTGRPTFMASTIRPQGMFVKPNPARPGDAPEIFFNVTYGAPAPGFAGPPVVGFAELGNSTVFESDHFPLRETGAVSLLMQSPSVLQVAQYSDPATPSAANPYFSDSYGNRLHVGQPFAGPQGIFSTYDLILFSQGLAADGNAVIFFRRARVTVANPGTGGSWVWGAQYLSDPVTLVDTAGNPFRYGIEPTPSLDGRLVIYHDSSTFTLHYSFNANPIDAAGNLNGAGWSVPKSITALPYEPDRLVAGVSFKKRYPLSQQPFRDALGQVYTAQDTYNGAYPWLSLDASELVHTAASLIQRDATGNVITRILDPATGKYVPGNASVAGRSAVSVIGRLTRWGVRHIDGTINRSRRFHQRQSYNSIGQFPSMWQSLRDDGPVAPPYPRSAGVPVMTLLGNVSGDYNEVTFEDAVDGHNLVYWRMNEPVDNRHPVTFDPNNYFPTVVSSLKNQFYTSLTQDTSGQFNYGELRAGAYYPQEAGALLPPSPGDRQDIGILSTHPEFAATYQTPAAVEEPYDRTVGINGQAVVFTDAGSIVLPHLRAPAGGGAASATLPDQIPRLSVQLWVKVLRKPSLDSGANGYRYLVHRSNPSNPLLGGSFDLVLEQNGQLQFSVWTAGGEYRRSGFVGPAAGVSDGDWHHLAFEYDGTVMRGYVDAQKILDAAYAQAGPLAPSTFDLVVGPGGLNAVTGGGAIARMLIDEFSLANVIRTPDEIAAAAFRKPVATSLSPSVQLPVGLRSDDLRIPLGNPGGVAAASLGKALFSETALSANHAISCASCHQGGTFASPGQPTNTGILGTHLTRNTPINFNRAFSLTQMLDGRAPSLEAQVDLPISAHEEMGFSTAAAAAALAASPKYASLFYQAFQSAPTADGVRRALASYERTLMSGGSPYDLYVNNPSSGALTEGQVRGLGIFRGKGRCITCHGGHNLTDELYHNTAIQPSAGADLGRNAVTLRDEDLFAFKTPSLRNAGQTAPYLHDGSVPDLATLVKLYNSGSRAVNPQGVPDPRIIPLGLSDQDMADLVDFLQNGLTGAVTEVKLQN